MIILGCLRDVDFYRFPSDIHGFSKIMEDLKERPSDAFLTIFF